MNSTSQPHIAFAFWPGNLAAARIQELESENAALKALLEKLERLLENQLNRGAQ